MSPVARLNQLAQRKQELLAASERHRRLIAVECAAVQQRLHWLDQTVSMVRRLEPYLRLATPLLAAWVGRREPRPRSWIQTIASALPMAVKVASAVQRFIQRPAP